MHSGKGYPSKAAYFNEFISCPDYKSLQAIVKSFPHLQSLVKERNFELRPCRGVVIRSGNDDNIHKAIKYGIWTTTYRNKHKLEQYWRDSLENKVDTYLFFSAVKSGHFEGVARLVSGYHQETFPFWWENMHGKFKGHFEIEWIYVKDITYKHFDGLVNELGEDFVKSKDCDDISEQTTKKVLEIYKNYKKNKSIFSSFNFFDTREKDELRSNTYTPEQMWMLRQQYEQQLQYMYALAQQQNYYGMPQVQPTQQAQFKQEVPMGGFVKAPGITPSNPGFQMNPLSKQKKNTKDKDSK